jgi:hypothetical protein
METTTPPRILDPPPPPPPPGGLIPPPTGGGMRGDQERLVWVLGAIRLALDSTVGLQPSPFPSELRELFVEGWPDAENSLNDATEALRNPAGFEELHQRLQKVGLTGSSLQLKTMSMDYHTRRYVGEILTYPARLTLPERFARFARPVFKCMNSIMGSLKDVLPGIEIAKEFKEHVEASVDALEQEE